MRMWMVMAVAAGVAAAQDPPKPPSDPPKAEEKASEEKKPQPEPPKKFEALDRVFRKPVCAIPLLNAMPKGAVNPDPMIIVPKGPVLDKMEIQVPAPSCDDVKDQKKAAEKK